MSSLDPKVFLIWTCVIIFAATGWVTIIGLVKKDLIKEKYLNKLFFALIVEIIGISVLGYRDFFRTEEEWDIDAEVHFVDAQGNELEEYQWKAINETKLIVQPQQVDGGQKTPPFLLHHRFTGNIDDGISLIYVCDYGSGWKPAVIKDFTIDSEDIKINSEDIKIRKRDDKLKKLDLVVKIKKIQSTFDSSQVIHSVSGGPPTNLMINTTE